MPRVDRTDPQRSMVRFLIPEQTKQRMRRSADSSAGSSSPGSVARALAAARLGTQGPQPLAAPQQLAPTVPARQTLIQPDAPLRKLPEEITVPLVTMWSPDDALVKNIVAPPRLDVTSRDARPTIARPNHEVNVADLKLSATAFPTAAPMLPASTTAPRVVPKREAVQQVSETLSKLVDRPTPAQVISLSDARVQQGSVAIPLANQSAPGAPSDTLAIGQSNSGKSSGQQDGKPTGETQGGSGTKTASTGSGTAGVDSWQGNGVGVATGAGSTGAGSTGSSSSVARISRPPNGRFGVVVVGSSASDQYPEAAELWSGRLIYSVYVQVGLGKSWILQYSIPRDDQNAAVSKASRPEAPWPYDIVRPTLAPSDYNSDAIMVHGFVNVAGRFDKLAVVFPTEFREANFILSALRQWQFRPSRQNDHDTEVEVLLIIPEQAE